MRYLLIAALLLTSSLLHADPQRPTVKYGKVDAAEFAPTVYKVDSTADAVYLYDKGNVYYEGNNQSFFSIVQERFCRIRLLHKQAFSDVATIEIPLYTPQKENTSESERLTTLEAATYNLENGKVQSVVVDKASIFKQQSGNWTTMKFTFPNIKEGSIIEFHYKKISNRFWDMDDWYFQGNYPRVWSEYQILMPEIFNFTMSKQVYQKIDLDTSISTKEHYTVVVPNATQASESFQVSSNAVNRIWGIANVPKIKPEPYISSLQNYIACLKFQLSSMQLPNMEKKNFKKSWTDVAKDLMEDEDFGKSLNASNSFLNDDIRSVDGKDSLSILKGIYNYVRDNYSCSKNRGYYLTQSLRQTWKSKKGNVADINILLIAALRSKGYDAEPVLIGTRDEIRPSDSYPFMSRFNYIVCKVNLANGKYYMLDAADKHLGFNHLNHECYNGAGRTINSTLPILVPLSPDSLMEGDVTFVNIRNDEQGKGLDGFFQSNKGYFGSQSLREKISGSSKKDYFDKIEKGFSYPLHISNGEIDSLNRLDDPATVRYSFNFEPEKEELIYFNPIFGNIQDENPFKASERIYPIEMPYKIKDTYILTMEIPKGYEVDDLPKSAKVSLFESDGIFQYLISSRDGVIQLNCKLEIKKATFDAEDYSTLREFFAFVVKKQKEPIVFKKIKN